jgi:mannose-6-phosphate isomerase-like protein (cupin superfamily)
VLQATLPALLAQLPGKVTAQWPAGERFVRAFAHGTLAVEVYAPVGADPQTPHAQDELYIVATGHGTFECAGERHAFAPGSAFFVPAGADHRFTDFSPDFATWVVFYGPPGGESPP